jgi:hypothetical protein
VPYRSLPPIREIYAPRRSSKPPAKTASDKPDKPVKPRIREPSRTDFLPVATAMLTALARGAAGYTQALFVVLVDELDGRRLVVQLVCNDASGVLRSVDAPTELVDAAARMVEADRQSGNNWRKLSVHATPKPDGGATLHVDVV